LNEGASAFRIWLVSVWLASSITSAVMMSTGTVVSSWLRGVREPTMVITSLASSTTWKSARAADSAPADTSFSTAV
jgi:hypothetical protein